ncbi:MAG: hypothetical protein ABEJ46_06085 [Gemmatimonadota bacterium]
MLGSLVLLLAVTAPSALWAQGGGGQRQTLMELRKVNRQLNKIRQQALQDSALQARREELTSYIKEQMRALDDSTAARVDRMDSLQADLETAQQAQDTAGARAAVKELRKLQKALGPARKKVMSRPEVRKRIKSFQQAVRQRMREINPKADSLLKRAAKLRAKLQGGMGSGGPGGSGG